MHYIFLFISILAEIVATTALKATNGFTNPLPTFVVLVGYLVAFYFFSLTLNVIPVGIAYAIWSALGIVFISLGGLLFYEQRLDGPAIVGIALIVCGVLVINLFSRSSA